VSRVLDGGPLDIKDKFSFQYEEVESAEDWERMVRQFCADAEKLIEQVGKLSPNELLADFAGLDYGSTQRNIDVLIEHSYYHLGQMVLIKKLLGSH
jgi:hypothetical protein